LTLEEEKDTTHELRKDNQKLKIKNLQQKHENAETTLTIQELERQQKDLQQETELTNMEIDQSAAAARNLRAEVSDLKNEKKMMEEEYDEIQHAKEKEMEQLDSQFTSQVEREQKKHERDKKLLETQTTDAVEKVMEVTDQLENSKKSMEKLAAATKKLERQTALASKQLETTEKEKIGNGTQEKELREGACQGGGVFAR